MPVSLFLQVYLCVCICIYVFIFVFVCCETLFSTTHTALMPAVPASLSTELQTSWLPHYCFQQCRARFLFCIFIFSTSRKKYLAGNYSEQFPPPRVAFLASGPPAPSAHSSALFALILLLSISQSSVHTFVYFCQNAHLPMAHLHNLHWNQHNSVHTMY